MRTLRAPTVVKFSQSFLLDRSFLLFTPAVRNDRPRITANAPKEENTASWCRYGGLFEPLSSNNDLGLYLEEHSCFPNCVSETSKNNADELTETSASVLFPSRSKASQASTVKVGE
ncbi:hypothetical protein V1478_002972 [Vespula squamosa]|uniref:Uncharacterized protein n=1 Tax=Vespula squamosa TaxID=30214 RepID=A0ABD2BRD8_VESSQ